MRKMETRCAMVENADMESECLVTLGTCCGFMRLAATSGVAAVPAQKSPGAPRSCGGDRLGPREQATAPRPRLRWLSCVGLLLGYHELCLVCGVAHR